MASPTKVGRNGCRVRSENAMDVNECLPCWFSDYIGENRCREAREDPINDIGVTHHDIARFCVGIVGGFFS